MIWHFSYLAPGRTIVRAEFRSVGAAMNRSWKKSTGLGRGRKPTPTTINGSKPKRPRKRKLMTFNMARARSAFMFAKKTYRPGIVWLKTAESLGMTVGQLTMAWNEAKRGEIENVQKEKAEF